MIIVIKSKDTPILRGWDKKGNVSTKNTKMGARKIWNKISKSSLIKI